MSKTKSDKAKKEFAIDNTKELKALRKKYADVLTDEESGKTYQPHFFAHISKLKGYYDPSKKIYAKQKTTMDYVQVIMNRAKRSHASTHPLPFVSMMDKTKYKKSNVNQNQIDFILKSLEELKSRQRYIWIERQDMSKAEKMKICQLEKQKCLEKIGKHKIGYSTMYELLTYLDDKEHKGIHSILFELLFQLGNSDFYSVIKQSQRSIDMIYQVTDEKTSENDVKMGIFGIIFAKTKQNSVENC